MATLGLVGCGPPSGSAVSDLSCSLTSVRAASSATAAPGAAYGAPVPVWTESIGRPAVVVGGAAYGVAQGHCITAVDVATGHLDWMVAPTSDHPELFGVLADSSTVLAATGIEVGQAPAMVSPLIDELVAYDSTTGDRRWRVALANDGQQVPAVLAGAAVVVSEADGSLLGLSETDGHQVWKDHAPKGCNTDTQDGLPGNASMVGLGATVGGVPTVIAATCAGGGTIIAVDAASGATRWSWRVPTGWTVDTQLSSTVVSGADGNRVVAAAISPIAPANAPPVIAPPPGPVRPTRIGNPYGYASSEDVVMIDALTGHLLWDLTNIVGTALTVGGAGSVCVLTDAGIDCRTAADGNPRWSSMWPAKNASAERPAMECLDLAGAAPPCAIASNGLLYLALPTASTPAYLPLPGPPSPPGTFVLTALRMDTGRVTKQLPLPAFNDSQASIAISLAAPPGVLVAANGVVLVTPEYEETDDVEAFAVPV